MARNERTKDLSKEFEVSAGRISQMRRAFQDGWRRFIGDEAICGRRRLKRRKRKGRA